MSFSADISKFVTSKAKRNPKLVRDGVSLKLFGAVIKDTPVDTGRLRANWQTSVNLPESRSTALTEDEGLDRAKRSLDQAHIRDVIYFQNNLEYAAKIEYGGSKQAPQGMMRKNVLRFQRLIDEEARRVSAR